MSKRLILAVFLIVAASAITASAVVVMVGQGGTQPDGEKIPPVKALKPSELTKIPPGTPVADLALPVEYGRFHILPPGNVPNVCSLAVPPGGGEGHNVDIRNSDTLDEFRDHALFFDPPYIPAGWELTRAHAETVIWDDGSRTDDELDLQYDRPGYFYIRIGRRVIGPDCKVELLAPPAGAAETLTFGEIRGVPVVYEQHPLRVHFVVGDVVTQIESPLMHLDELIKIADALIGEMEEASP